MGGIIAEIKGAILNAAQKAWVTAGQTAVADGADLVDANDLGTAAYAASGDFDAAGSAAAAQAASQPLDADLTAIAGLSSADSNFIVGSATGWVAESGATARTSLGLGTIATAAAGDYPLLSSFSAAPTAAEPLKADGSGGVVGKSINLNGITVADFTSIFPGKAATLFGITQSSSVATGGMSANGFTNTNSTGIPVIFTGYHGSVSPTVPTIIFRAAKHNGSTSAVALAAAEAIFQIRNWTTTVMTILGSGAVGLRTDTPAAQLHILPNGAAALGLIIQMPTSATGNSFEVRDVSGNTLGQIGPAGNMALGQQSTASHEISGKLKSSTTANTQAARIAWAWTVATHASRTATLTLYASDYGGERTGLQIGANGTGPTVGFYGVTPVARQLLATGTGATVDNVITALQNLGLLRQS